MNEIALNQTTTAITSLEIAERTGKGHKNVLADIRNMLEEMELTTAEFSAVYTNEQNKPQPMFLLPKREALILATGYSTKLRAALIDRIEELEAQARRPLDMSRFTYMGLPHDPSRAGMYFAALEAKVLPKNVVAKKYGLLPGFIDALVRLPDWHLAEMGKCAGNSADEVDVLEAKFARVEATKQKLIAK